MLAAERKRAGWVRLLERVGPWVALLGLTASLVPDYRMLASQIYPGVDFRVVYAAEVQFAHGGNPYDIAPVPGIFREAAFAAMPGMFGHLPVYPPFTFALLWPVGLLRGAVALWGNLLFSAALMALALSSLLRFAEEELELPLVWRLGLLAMFAASPLLAFGLEIGNLSVPVSALCMLAVTQTERRWVLAAGCLALGLLLKPHLAFWVLVGLALAWGQVGRKVAGVSAVLAGVVVGISTALLAATGRLHGVMSGYLGLLQYEQSSGSMSPASLEKLPIGAQITSLVTLPGYFQVRSGLTTGFVVLALGILALLLIRASWRQEASAEGRLRLVCGWVGLGMVATYHRDHDAILLLLLLPVLLVGWRSRPANAWPWLEFLGLLLISVALPVGSGFVALRQGALGMLLLAVLLALGGKKKAVRAVF